MAKKKQRANLKQIYKYFEYKWYSGFISDWKSLSSEQKSTLREKIPEAIKKGIKWEDFEI